MLNRIIVIVLVVFGVAACGSSGGPAATETAAGVIPPLPVQQFMFTMPQVADANHARFVLAAQCMKTFGIDFAVPPSDAAAVHRQVELQSRRYGITDPAVVATRGFHPPAGVTRPAQPLTAGLNAAQIAVFYGQSGSFAGKPVPAGGCDGAAIRAIAPHGNFARSDLTARISADAFQRSQSDPTLTGVFARWSACMRDAGYAYATPLASVGDRRWAAPDISAAELAAAKADLACKARTNLVAVWSGVESRLETTEIAAHQAELDSIKTDRDAQLARIRSILLNG